MCGISGFLSTKGKSNLHDLCVMNNLAQHRGPDDEGYALFDFVNNKTICAGGKDTPIESWEFKSAYQPIELIEQVQGSFQVGLAHRRLSILDLSPLGHLPMADLNSNYWITYNGEVYNFLELKSELQALGYPFKTGSDTEVILYSYIQWGKQCVEKFEGMFAIVIVDIVQQQVFIARDVFGIKPLYYWVDGNGVFYFASEIKQFTQLPGWKAILNKPRAFEYLYYSLTDHTQETLFMNVFQLMPANRVTLDLAKVQIWEQGKPIVTETYFRFKPRHKKDSFENAALDFRTKFEESVALHLRSDVKIGSALSGGLDSTAIVCQINKILKSTGKSDIQNTFSAISDNPKYSEQQWMAEVIKSTGVNSHFVTPQKENVIKLTPKILWHMDEPYQSQSAYLGYHVFELAAKNGVKVLLNGQGADEYLSGYEEFRFLRWYRMFKGLKLPSLFKELFFYFGLSPLIWIKYIFKFINISLPTFITDFFSKKSLHFNAYSKIIPPSSYLKQFQHPFTHYHANRKAVETLIVHQLYCSPLPRFLRWEDRNSMAHSVEARVPFLYTPLVNHAMAQPLDYLDGLNESKKLMLRGLQELLPEAIFNRKDKKGFITAEEAWVKQDEDGSFEKLFRERVLTLGELVNKDEAIKYYLKLKSSEIPFDYLYWRIILLSWWIEIFKIDLDS
jgi:asparagine synthase (glutamine-hydrolysing)